MKLLFVVSAFFLLTISNAFAYLEVESAGDAKATANEQTTNLYLLTNSNNTTLKRLKKIEEVYEKNPELAKKLSRSEIEQIAGGDAKELQRQDILKETKQYLHRAIADNKVLSVKKDVYFYQQLTENALSSNTDEKIIGSLRAKIGRGR